MRGPSERRTGLLFRPARARAHERGEPWQQSTITPLVGVYGAYIACPCELAGPGKVPGGAHETANDDVVSVKGATSAGAKLAESTAGLDELLAFRVGLL